MDDTDAHKIYDAMKKARIRETEKERNDAEKLHKSWLRWFQKKKN